MKTLEETFKYLEKFEGISTSVSNFAIGNDGSYDLSISLNKEYVEIWLDWFGENDTSIKLTFKNKEKMVKFSGTKPLLPKKEDLEDVLNYFLRLKPSNKQREIDRIKADIKELEDRLKELNNE